MLLEDADIITIGLLLSQERLAALQNLTGSTRIAIELHQATLSLNADLMNVIASIELALRNTVYDNLTVYFRGPDWLVRPRAPFKWKKTENTNVKKALDSAQRAEYAKMTQAQKGALDTLAYPHGRPPNSSPYNRAVDRRRQIDVSDGKIIAETTLYFWKRLFGPDYEQTLWRTTLKKTFPNKLLKRSDVADKLEDIYQARNRLAHHEPVLHKRFRDTLAAIEFIAENLGRPSPSKDSPLFKLIADDLRATKHKAEALHARLATFRKA